MARARSKIMTAAGISLAVAIGVTGCGQVQKLSAKDAVTDALDGFNDAKSATFTVKLDSTIDNIKALSAAEGDSLSKADLSAFKQVLAGDLVFSVEAPNGKTFGESAKDTSGAAGTQDLQSLLGDPQKLSELLKKQGAFAMSARLSGDALVDLRSVDGKIYARADVKKILGLAGENPNTLDQQLSSLPPSMAPLAKAAKGEWVSLDLAKAASAAKDSGLLDALPTSQPTPTMDAAKVNKLVESLKTAYRDKATITELGDSDRGKGYRLGAPAKQVAQAVSGDLIALVGKSAEKDIRSAINDIPDKTFNLDLWVKDDKLSGVALDLGQFADEPVAGKKVAIDVAIDVDSGEVSAPDGATEIDVKQLLSQIPAGALSGGAGSAGAGLDTGSGSSAGGTELTDEQMEQMKQSTGMTEEEIEKMMAGVAAGQ